MNTYRNPVRPLTSTSLRLPERPETPQKRMSRAAWAQRSMMKRRRCYALASFSLFNIYCMYSTSTSLFSGWVLQVCKSDYIRSHVKVNVMRLEERLTNEPRGFSFIRGSAKETRAAQDGSAVILSMIIHLPDRRWHGPHLRRQSGFRIALIVEGD